MVVRTYPAIVLSVVLMLVLSTHSYAARDIKSIDSLNHKSVKIGTFHALIIGIQNYDDPNIDDLKTPLKDAIVMADILKSKYGFKVETLLDRKATKRAIYNTLLKLVGKSKKNDSVIIYFAGHGDIDKILDSGWWIPVDARGGDPVTYLDNTQVQKVMRAIEARHVLLISDSCYSGTLFGQKRVMPQVITEKYYLNLYNEKSRWGMTSGNKTPVSDSGAAGHSVFAYQLIKELKKNNKPYLTTQELFTKIAPIIGNNSEQAPLCRPIMNTGDQGGEFVFIARGITTVANPAATDPGNGKLVIMSEPTEAAIFVDGSYNGRTPLDIPGMDSGTYTVRAELKGYDAIDKKVKVNAGRKAVVTFYFQKKDTKARLYVTTSPSGCRVRILNIKPTFYNGIELDPGNYRIEVSKPGYKTSIIQGKIESSKEAIDLYVKLEKQVDLSIASGTASPEQTWKDSVTDMEFVWVPGGCYQMGSNFGDEDEKPIHEVCLDGFWMGKYEVTQEQWAKVMGEYKFNGLADTFMIGSKKYTKIIHPSGRAMDPVEFNIEKLNYEKGGKFPVTAISFDQGLEFVGKLNLANKGGYSFRLPTEAEWEYACRSKGNDEIYSGGNDLDRVGVYENNSSNKFHKVGTKAPNGIGIYDMSGNVIEWIIDTCDSDSYLKHKYRNPVSKTDGACQGGRGGGWRSEKEMLRCTSRWGSDSGISCLETGLRLIRLP